MDSVRNALLGGALGAFITVMSAWYWFDILPWRWGLIGGLVCAVLALFMGRSFLDLLRKWFDWPIN